MMNWKENNKQKLFLFKEYIDKFQNFFAFNEVSMIDLFWFEEMEYSLEEIYENHGFCSIIIQKESLYYALPFYFNEEKNLNKFLSSLKNHFETKYNQCLKLLDVKNVFYSKLDKNLFNFKSEKYDEEYFYETKNLKTFNGKNLQKKRNNLNYFLKNYPNWKVENLNLEDEIMQEKTLEYYLKWIKEHDKNYFGLNIEKNIIIKNFKSILNLENYIWAILLDNKMELQGFLCACKTANVINLHFLKSNYLIRGSQQFLISTFLKNNFQDCVYVNFFGTVPYLDLEKSKALAKYKDDYFPCFKNKVYSITFSQDEN